jgi:hypothetical protein
MLRGHQRPQFLASLGHNLALLPENRCLASISPGRRLKSSDFEFTHADLSLK